MSILIKGALLDGAVTDVYIEKKEIRQVGTDLQVQADQVIDGRRKALIPGFVNAHTHTVCACYSFPHRQQVSRFHACSFLPILV